MLALISGRCPNRAVRRQGLHGDPRFANIGPSRLHSAIHWGATGRRRGSLRERRRVRGSVPERRRPTPFGDRVEPSWISSEMLPDSSPMRRSIDGPGESGRVPIHMFALKRSNEEEGLRPDRAP